jgi:hypothetical protein
MGVASSLSDIISAQWTRAAVDLLVILLMASDGLNHSESVTNQPRRDFVILTAINVGPVDTLACPLDGFALLPASSHPVRISAHAGVFIILTLGLNIVGYCWASRFWVCCKFWAWRIRIALLHRADISVVLSVSRSAPTLLLKGDWRMAARRFPCRYIDLGLLARQVIVNCVRNRWGWTWRLPASLSKPERLAYDEVLPVWLVLLAAWTSARLIGSPDVPAGIQRR